jgi:hypothetical protein
VDLGTSRPTEPSNRNPRLAKALLLCFGDETSAAAKGNVVVKAGIDLRHRALAQDLVPISTP